MRLEKLLMYPGAGFNIMVPHQTLIFSSEILIEIEYQRNSIYQWHFYQAVSFVVGPRQRTMPRGSMFYVYIESDIWFNCLLNVDVVFAEGL